MRKIKRPKIGEYVLLARWSDKTMFDPWYVGYVDSILEDKCGLRYRAGGSGRYFPHCWRITKEEGESRIKLSGDMRESGYMT